MSFLEQRQRPFISEVRLRRERFTAGYPFDLPAFRTLRSIRLNPGVTFFVGDNGSGKSTLLEAIAVAAGYNAEGGSQNFRFSTRSSESSLHHAITLVRTERRPRTGFFLRAESFFNLATNIEELDAEPGPSPKIISSFGGRSLHEQSHGESFWSLFTHRLGPNGLYLFDEPEAALSPRNQVHALRRMLALANEGSQFLVATHSPILLAYPGATLYELGQSFEDVAYEDCQTTRVYRDFLHDPEGYVEEVGRQEAATKGTPRT